MLKREAISAHRALSETRFYAVRLYAVCMRPFWHSQQERSVCTAAVQPAPDGLYQVGMSIRAYCLTMILCPLLFTVAYSSFLLILLKFCLDIVEKSEFVAGDLTKHARARNRTMIELLL